MQLLSSVTTFKSQTWDQYSRVDNHLKDNLSSQSVTESVTKKRVQDGDFIRVCENEPEEYGQSQGQNVTGEDSQLSGKGVLLSTHLGRINVPSQTLRVKSL